MGVYYHLYNNTKKECVHYDDNVKAEPWLENKQIHKAIMNYLMENRGDNIQFLSDEGEETEEQINYKDIDLKSYKNPLLNN